MDDATLPPVVGQLIGDPVARAAWRDLIAGLVEAAGPGGPLEGYLFHGTCADTAALVRYEGVTTTYAIAGDMGAESFEETEGTHWGTPLVAAFYAEDLIEKHDDPDLPLAMLAVRMSDLGACGTFAVDGQTLDCPLSSRLGKTDDEVHAAWDASAKDWRACLDVMGTLLVLGPVPPGDVHVLEGPPDLPDLLAELDSVDQMGPHP